MRLENRDLPVLAVHDLFVIHPLIPTLIYHGWARTIVLLYTGPSQFGSKILLISALLQDLQVLVTAVMKSESAIAPQYPGLL